MSDPAQALARALASATRVAALSGAGISAESGVPTFRGPGGLWEGHRGEELATPEAFARDPELVWRFYDWRRTLLAGLEPNPGHRALAALDARVPEFLLATQNVDGLHERAGARRVVELHGNIWRLRCAEGCGHDEDDRRAPMPPPLPPRCACGAFLRPGVVWFGEMLPERAFTDAIAAASSAEVFLVIGTSALVEPAASLGRIAADAGALVAEINPDATPLTSIASLTLREPSGVALPRVMDELEALS